MKRISLIVAALLVLAVLPVSAQQAVNASLNSLSTAGVLDTNGDTLDMVIPLNIGFGSVGVEARGTWVGTIQVECTSSRGGGTFEALTLSPRATSTTATSFASNGQWSASINGCQQVRARATAWTSGAATVTMSGSFAGGAGGSGAAGAVTVTSGTISCTNCSGSGASNTEDNAHVNADPLAPAGAVRKATPVNLSGTDGDYEPLQMSAGRLWVDASGVTLTVGAHAVTNAGTFAVQESGGALTSLQLLDNAIGTVGAGTAATASVLSGGVFNATPITLSNTQGSALQLDSAGALIVSGGGGGVQYAEDAVHASGNTGTLALVVRNDAGTALAADGDNIPLTVNSAGALYVTGAGGGTQYTEDAAETAGASLTLAGSVRRDTAASSAGTTGDNATINTDATGRLWSNTELPDAATLSDATSNPTVPAVASFIMAWNGSSWDRAQLASDKTEDVTHSDGGTGPFVLSRRIDAAASSAGTSGDYASFNTDSIGRLWVSGAVVEDAAETAADALVSVGSVRRDTAASSAGTSGDNATVNTDGLGRLWVRGGNPCQDHARIQQAVISTSASGNVEIVGLNGSDLIYVCGYSVIAGAATGVQLIYGTGTACATGETDMTGVWSFAANGGIQQPNAGAPQFVVPAGNAFCVENSGANAIAGHVTYVRTAAP